MRNFSIRHSAFFSLLLLFFIFLSYNNCIHKEFLLDDEMNLTGAESLNTVGFVELFTRGFHDFYRPVPFAVLKVALSIFKLNPAAYHIYSLVIFFGICWMFFLIIRKLTKNMGLAILSSLLYAVHPINNFYINYKTASNAMIGILCVQVTIYLFVQYLDSGKIIFRWASAFMYLISLFAHEVNFMVPIYIALIIYFFNQERFKDSARIFIPLAAVFLLYLFIRSHTAANLRAPAILSMGFSPLEALATLTKLLGWYVSKLFVPTHIIFIWDERMVKGLAVYGYILLFLLILSCLIVILKRGKRSVWAFGLILFVTGLLPSALAAFTYTSQFQTGIMEPHWFGFTSIGFFMLMAAAFLQFKKIAAHKSWVIFPAAALLGLALLTHASNDRWKDDKTYCEYWLQENSLNGTPWNCLAKRFITDFNENFDPAYYRSCRKTSLLGGAFHAIGQAQEALNYYSLAIQTNPSCAYSYYGLSLFYEQLGRIPESQKALSQGTKTDRSFYPIYSLVRREFFNQGEKDDGKKILQSFKGMRDSQ